MEIKKEDIQEKVMSEISKAEKEILATMDITEEQHSPLPREYFSLLERKIKEGIKVRRIIFGSKKFKDNKLFSGKCAKSKNYKRMLMIDGIKLFFRKKTNGKEKFYFTTDERYIKKYKNYFNKA